MCGENECGARGGVACASSTHDMHVEVVYAFKNTRKRGVGQTLMRRALK